MTRRLRNQDNDPSKNDHNVLTIFLPILAVAIAVCAGGCFYMEKKRKKRIKRALENPNYLQDDHISDTDSISTVSSRHRPYLLPTATTGRTFRTASRAGSIRSDYDRDSSYGEPPPYSGRTSRRSSLASTRASEENSFKRKGVYNEGFDGSSLSRSKSMLDVRDSYDTLPPLRRTRSSHNFSRFSPSYQDDGYQSRARYDDDIGMRRRPIPSARSEWSIHTAPNPTGYDPEYVAHNSSSVASLPVGGSRSNLKKSYSQPNLSRSGSNRTMTYPQGILKRNAAAMSDDGRYDYSGIASESDNKDFYVETDSGKGSKANSQVGDTRRSTSRSQAGYGSRRGQYDGYNSYPTYPGMPQRGYDDHSYNASVGAGYPQQFSTNTRGDWRQQQYPQNYDPYSQGGSNYWDQQSASTNPYVYGSMIY